MAAPRIEETDGMTAARVAERVLRSLPEWFGLEEPLRAYIDDARTLPTFVAADHSGFVTLKQHSTGSVEIHAMGVLPTRHRGGVGQALVEAAVEFARAHGARLLEVKTLGPSHPSEGYARTRAFYESLGFIPLEESVALWGPTNPCLVLVMPL